MANSLKSRGGHPTSCDTFVCLPPRTKNGMIIFGKNSDRPSEEVQEIVYYPRKTYGKGEMCKCTFIEIPQVEETHATILSKPSWMWGAEMGSNSHGLCIGNEAVWTNAPIEQEKQLLGMDFLRLGLERAATCEDAINVITVLLEKYGQGGPCSETTSMTYHNSFLLADKSGAWVLETAGRAWAAEKVSEGCRNISNSLSIGPFTDKCLRINSPSLTFLGSRMTRSSSGLKDYALELGLWKKDTEFNFAKTFEDDDGDCPRYIGGRKLLETLSSENKFDVKSMMSVLRDDKNGINMGGYDGWGSSVTASSQVSIIDPKTGSHAHWFTGTPNPKKSLFKPFVFPTNLNDEACGAVTQSTQSPPMTKEDLETAGTRKTKATLPDRRHPLYRLHEAAYHHKPASKTAGSCLRTGLTQLEADMVDKVEADMRLGQSEKGLTHHLFAEGVQKEIELYNQWLNCDSKEGASQ